MSSQEVIPFFGFVDIICEKGKNKLLLFFGVVNKIGCSINKYCYRALYVV